MHSVRLNFSYVIAGITLSLLALVVSIYTSTRVKGSTWHVDLTSDHTFAQVDSSGQPRDRTAASPAANLLDYIVITETPVPTSTPRPTATPIPTATPLPPAPEHLENAFNSYSSQFNVSKDQLKKIAICESGLNTQARNGIYGGLFQFSEETWRVTRSLMGADNNPDMRFNSEESIKTAAFKISRSGVGAWMNCR